tara:strand:- start:316 stop:861 length:546 start_codon:yes stop_codon:yes gene_type:complete
MAYPEMKRNKTMEMINTFETTDMKVLIEDVTSAGSAFGSNEQGASVFFSSRLVERMDLDFGDIVSASAIPNYEDKREDTPWRAIRVMAVADTATIKVAQTARSLTYPEVDSMIYDALQDPDVNYWTVSDIADALDLDTKAVGNSCRRLFSKSLIAQADVHGAPDQERASFCLWARNIHQFK